MNKINFLPLLVISIAFFSSCKEKKTAWDDPLSVYSDNISNYYDASLGANSKSHIGNQAVFIDFSIGIKQALSQQTISNLIKIISGNLQGDQLDWWGMGKDFGGIGPIAYEKNRDFFNKVTTLASYNDKLAPIEEALKKITTLKNDALLITDFEEYTLDGKEHKSPFAAQFFTKWIEDGNSITIFYSKFPDGNGGKNLYFVIFSYGVINDSSLLSKFKTAIKGRENELGGLENFEISTNPYSVSNNYGGKEKTGLTLDSDVENQSALDIGDKDGALLFYQNGFTTEEKSRPFEAFEFGQNLNELYEFYFKGKRRFAKKLNLDASNNIPFMLKNIKVQVTDVTADYTNYIKSLEAKNNVPELENDEGNNKVWTKKDSENPIILECYEKNTKNLKKEYQYKYTQGESVSEIFDFESKIFLDRMTNSPSEVELVTTFHKNFVGKYSANEQVILRLDYLIESTDGNYATKIDSFKWDSVIDKKSKNESLKESIQITLNKVKPKGLLYSYFLKLEPNK